MSEKEIKLMEMIESIVSPVFEKHGFNLGKGDLISLCYAAVTSEVTKEYWMGSFTIQNVSNMFHVGAKGQTKLEELIAESRLNVGKVIILGINDSIDINDPEFHKDDKPWIFIDKEPKLRDTSDIAIEMPITNYHYEDDISIVKSKLFKQDKPWDTKKLKKNNHKRTNKKRK